MAGFFVVVVASGYPGFEYISFQSISRSGSLVSFIHSFDHMMTTINHFNVYTCGGGGGGDAAADAADPDTDPRSVI